MVMVMIIIIIINIMIMVEYFYFYLYCCCYCCYCYCCCCYCYCCYCYCFCFYECECVSCDNRIGTCCVVSCVPAGVRPNDQFGCTSKGVGSPAAILHVVATEYQIYYSYQITPPIHLSTPSTHAFNSHSCLKSLNHSLILYPLI